MVRQLALRWAGVAMVVLLGASLFVSGAAIAAPVRPVGTAAAAPPGAHTAQVGALAQVSSIAGGGTVGPLQQPVRPDRMAVRGNDLWFGSDHAVWHVDRTTHVSRVVAGTGVPGFSGDGGPGPQAQLDDLEGLAVDAAGNVYVVDSPRVRRIDAVTGVITTVAGNGIPVEHDGGPATASGLYGPLGVAVAPNGDLIITTSSQIKRVTAAGGIITTIAGVFPGGPFGGDGGPALAANLYRPMSPVFGLDGAVIVADSGNYRVRRIDPVTNVITTIVGRGDTNYPWEGPATAVGLDSPIAVARLSDGTLGVLQSGGRITMVDPAQNATTVAPPTVGWPTSGNDLVAAGPGEMLYASVAGGEVRSIAWPSGAMVGEPVNTPGFQGDGGPATQAVLQDPGQAVRAPNGDLYVADHDANRVRKIDAATGIISTVVGTGPTRPLGCSPTTAGRQGTATPICGPRAIAFDGAGNLFIADDYFASDYSRGIWRRDATTGLMSIIVTPPDTSVIDMISDGATHLVLSDWAHNQVLRMSTVTGQTELVAGNSANAHSGDLGLATAAGVYGPRGLALALNGDLYIAEVNGGYVRKVTASTGIITTVAGMGKDLIGRDLPVHDGVLATQSGLTPWGLAVDSDGNLYIGTSTRVRKLLASSGVITTLAGGPTPGFAGDGGSAASARFSVARDVALDPGGALLVSDGDGWNGGGGATANNRIRRITAPGVPSAPSQPTASRGDNGAVTVAWTPPQQTGGAPVAGYTVTADPGGRTCFAESPATTCTVTNLTLGQGYRFRVTTLTAGGTSPSSAPSNSVLSSGPAGFTAITPTRVLDTRPGGVGQQGTFGAGEARTLQVAGVGNVPPSGVSAVALNVTAVNPSFPTYVTIWPTGAPRPGTSSLNAAAGSVTPNQVYVALDGNGRIDLFNAFGTVDLVVDVAGWFDAGDVVGARYYPVQPKRIMDTRTGVGGPVQPFGGPDLRDLDVLKPLGLSVGQATSVVLNVTAVDPSTSSYVTIWPKGDGIYRPTASNLNPSPGVTRPNLVTVKVGTDGLIFIQNAYGSVDLIIDIVGFYGYVSGQGSLFVATTPTRMLDTRPDAQIGLSGAFGASETRRLLLAGRGPVPGGVTGVAMNLVGVLPSKDTYVTVWPAASAQPLASTLDPHPGSVDANLALTAIDVDGAIRLYNFTGSVDLVGDVTGYFVSAPV